MSEHRRAPNMADVAARAGLSHQTVWRVISGHPGVRESTRSAVLAAVDELGYRRNLAASRLATSRTTTIGVLAPAVANFGPTSSLYAVERAIREAGYFPLIASTEPRSARDDVDFLLDHHPQALIVIAAHEATLHALRALQPGIPIVVLQAGRTRLGMSVTIDQTAGVRAVVRHLMEAGHTRIQHLAGPGDFIEAGLRARAFRRETARYGLPELPLLRGDWSSRSGSEAATLVDPTATAVFCGNDHMALGLIHALTREGRQVPGELSVVGFDDVPEAAYLTPALTTIHQDFGMLGHHAVAAALSELGGQAGAARSAIAPRLMVRASTAEAAR